MTISIITASYNYEKYIKDTIESVLSQTYSDWEMIIVDDGSKDKSRDIIKEYCEKDSRIKLYTHEKNVNKGLAETIQLVLLRLVVTGSFFWNLMILLLMIIFQKN